jgi:hypothetical protein
MQDFGGRARPDAARSGVGCALMRSARINNTAGRAHEKQSKGRCAVRRAPAGNGQKHGRGKRKATPHGFGCSMFHERKNRFLASTSVGCLGDKQISPRESRCYSNCTTMHMVARANDSCGCLFAADGPKVIPLGRTLHMSNLWRYLVLALRMENAHQEVLDSDDSGNSTCCGDETECESWPDSSPIGSRLLARKIENQQELQAQQTFVLPSAPIVACRLREGKGSENWM